MEKQELVYMNALLSEASSYLKEKKEDYSLELEEQIEEDAGLANPMDIVDTKEAHKMTIRRSAEAITKALESGNAEVRPSEPLWQGDTLEVYEKGGSYEFYENGDRIFSVTHSRDENKRTEVLCRIVRGEKLEPAIDRTYSHNTSRSDTRQQFEGLVDESGKADPDLISEVEEFLDQENNISPGNMSTAD